MKKSWRAFLKISVKILIVLVILVVIAVYAGVNDALHPPRRIPQGKTLHKYSIPYQSIDLITEDGIRLSWVACTRRTGGSHLR